MWWIGTKLKGEELMNARRMFLKLLGAGGIAFSTALFAVLGQTMPNQQVQEQHSIIQASPLIPVRCMFRSVLTAEMLQCVDGAGRDMLIVISEGTVIWRGTYSRTLSDLQPGDDLTIALRADGSGNLIAQKIWANLVNIRGVIRSVTATSFEVQLDTWGYTTNQPTMKVFYDGNVEINTGSAGTGVLQSGVSVQVIGLKGAKDGEMKQL
jgi:hypothetical protein